jgi:hypothetical protein
MVRKGYPFPWATEGLDALKSHCQLSQTALGELHDETPGSIPTGWDCGRNDYVALYGKRAPAFEPGSTFE